MQVIMLVSGIVVLITCLAFFLYEFYSFRGRMLQKISTYGQIISRNSTAALAFEDKKDAAEILDALKAEKDIVLAVVYDSKGNVFCSYSAGDYLNDIPAKPGTSGYYLTNRSAEGFQPIIENGKTLGMLFIRFDLKAMYSRFELYSVITIVILCFSFLVSFFLSKFLQRRISMPILALEETANAISERKDYSVRATKLSDDEVGALTDAFNLMLTQIQEQTKTLSDFNQNLEQKVKDRTSELEAANAELGSFSYSVSHDLRAPVRSINGYMTIFMHEHGDKLDEDGKRLTKAVLRNAVKMGALIDDLLSFSQLGRRELTKADLSMNDLVLSTWDEVSKTVGDRNVAFNLKTLPAALAEKSTMRQVWVNLISNALKYSRNREKAVIDISGEQKDGEIIYRIQDNGSGFDMRYYDKLFGVFQRLHSQEEFEGTGVGLAIVERVIKKHGGRIWAESELDHGATFYFSLPVN